MSVCRHCYCYLMLVVAAMAIGGCDGRTPSDLAACTTLYVRGFRPIADERTERFLGKVREETARCRGGETAVAYRDQPWMDWPNYWATGGPDTRVSGLQWLFGPNDRGLHGALLDIEYSRMELIKFNLLDNSGTYQEYVLGRNSVNGQVLKEWTAMRLSESDPNFSKMKFESDGRQLCQGELIRFRNLTGICNDIRNPRMGSTNEPFARNVEFESTFPELARNDVAKNRHGDRIGLLVPDPQVVSRKLFTRAQSQPDKCRAGLGLPGYSPEANCDYKKAPFFNVLAAFWIQFMTHDWFTHLENGHNREVNNKPDLMPVGCTPDQAKALGCRSDDQVDRSYITEAGKTFVDSKSKTHLATAYRTTTNNVTAWWDASQIYGYDQTSQQRVKRDPHDKAKLLLEPVRANDPLGYLPVFGPGDPINDAWRGQEASAFPDNWSIGMSFYHNVFAREHNKFVENFRSKQKDAPKEDSGLRNPERPDAPILYEAVSDEELFQVTRLVVSAEIAKIHTIEWTTQLLYDEPLNQGMNANWNGLFGKSPLVAGALKQVVSSLKKSSDPREANQLYSAFVAGPGIFGRGNEVNKCLLWSLFCQDIWSLKNPDDVNGGTNHFGSPFNFPEEFVTVYRLHSLLPDLIEYREWNKDPNVIEAKIPVIETFRGKATDAMHEHGLANWGLSMGRQRLGQLALLNQPQFIQNLPMPRLETKTNQIDLAALDLIRDREHGVPRFNEFRRQYGLKQLTSFDDFVDKRLPKGTDRDEQEQLVKLLREVYGQHKCDASKKPITTAQRNDDGTEIDDCLGHPNGSMVDNIEDLDTVVGYLAEPKVLWPHGYAISETQFQVFILNASRRLFSDRFFTSSFRPEFYTHLGVEWVVNNGPNGKVMEKGRPNGHEEEVTPLKRVLQRTIPELAPQLDYVVNAFDPWGRDRGEYYALDWKPRPGAESDPAFK